MSRDALVIGINIYEEFLPLEKPANDAEAIARLLETKGGFRVRRLPCIEQDGQLCIDDSGAVGFEQLQQEIVQLFDPDTGDLPETVLLFFAGHNLKDGFIAASDTNPNSQKAISFQWLADLLQVSPILQQIVWIDACFSGKFFEYVKTSSKYDRCLITSARSHEEALDQGLLTQALLEALDYNKQSKDTPWVNSDALIHLLEEQNKVAEGWQRFQFQNNGKSIVLTNEAFENKVYESICPFKGLSYFDNNPNDARFFKGRTKLINELLEKTKNTNFLAVLGASGNGKSSIVRAGLIYQLRQTEKWQILPIITPTANPIKVLNSIIGRDVEQLTDFIDQTQTERLLLIIDQFEEVFTLCQDDVEREQFFAALLTKRKDDKFCLVIVMRAEFLNECSQYYNLAKKIQDNQIIITPMTPTELEEVIVEPTKQVGLQIEPKLVSEMLVDFKDASGGLTLLQYTLKELWKKCAKSCLLTFSAYENLGKIAGTLENAANKIYEELSTTEQKVAKRIFIELTQLGEGSSDTSRQLHKQDLVASLPFESNIVEQVIEKLVNANLLTTDNKEQESIVNISHETLIQHWGQLRKWLDENRDAIKIQRDIEVDAKKFEESHQSKDALLQGLDLSIAKNYVKTHTEKVPLSALTLDFVQESIALQEQEIAKEKQRQEERERLLQEAQLQAQIALIEKLTVQSVLATENPSKSNDSYEHALLLAVQSFKEKDNGTSRSNLLRVLQAKHEKPQKFLYGHSEEVLSIAFNPNGMILASGSADNTVKLWDSKTGKILGELHGHSSQINSVAFNFDGKILASGSSDKTIILWDVTTKKIIDIPLEKHSGEILSITFSHDGQLFASGSKDGTVILWDTESRIALDVLSDGHPGWILSLAFSPDGKILASGGKENISLWNVESKELLDNPSIYSPYANGIAFSPDGNIMVTGNSEGIAFNSYGNPVLTEKVGGTVRLFDIATRQTLTEPLKAHSSYVYDVAFSPDGQIFASGSDDKTIILWDIKTKQTLSKLSDGYSIKDIEFSPNGKVLAASSLHSNTVRLWNIEKEKPLRKLLIGQSEQVHSLAFSPDGKIIASGASRGAVILWDIETQQAIGKPLMGDTYMLTNLAFSPDSKILISVGWDGIIRLWNIETQQQLGKSIVATKISNKVIRIDFSADGKTIISGSSGDDGYIIKIWDIETQKLVDKPITGNPIWIYNVIFNSDGKMFAPLNDSNIITLLDTETNKIIGKPFIGHLLRVTKIVFSPDDKILVAGDEKGQVRVWDVESRKQIGEPIINLNDTICSVVFSPNGKMLAAGSANGNIELFDVNPKSWAKKACAIVNRNFSHKEWQKYMGNHRPHEKTCPNLPKDTLGAIELTQQARELLKEGKKELAKKKFTKAMEWDENVVFGDEGL